MAIDLIKFMTNDKHITSELKQHHDILKNLTDDLKWLYNQAVNHQTVDTLAKKYYLTGNRDLIKLKKTLIAFFQISQLVKFNEYSQLKKQICLDNRYDSLGERGIRTSGDIFLLYKFHNSLINNLLVK